MTTPPTKTCSRCGHEKTIDEFYCDNRNSGHKTSRCKDCIKLCKAAARERNRQPKRESQPFADPKMEARRIATIVYNAIRDKKIIRPKICPICNDKFARVFANHTGPEPLDITWACRVCMPTNRQKKLHKGGFEALKRATCKKCGDTTLVIQGKSSCCGV